jgi:hypothetical protein
MENRAASEAMPNLEPIEPVSRKSRSEISKTQQGSPTSGFLAPRRAAQALTAVQPAKEVLGCKPHTLRAASEPIRALWRLNFVPGNRPAARRPDRTLASLEGQ